MPTDRPSQHGDPEYWERVTLAHYTLARLHAAAYSVLDGTLDVRGDALVLDPEPEGLLGQLIALCRGDLTALVLREFQSTDDELAAWLTKLRIAQEALVYGPTRSAFPKGV
jgi:hypothetical protein